MRYHELTEAVADHLEMAKAASQAALAVCRKLDQGIQPDHHVDIEGYGPFFVYDFGLFGLHAIPGMEQYCLMLGLRDPDKAIDPVTGGVFRLNPPLLDHYTRCLVIYGLTAMKVETVQELVGTRLLTVLKHEFIHVYDTLRNPKITSGELDSSDRQRYFNHAAEFHAYLHEVMDRLTSIAQENNPEIREFLAQSYGITGDFKRDLAMLLKQNDSTREFVSWLTASRRKALLKRVYAMHQFVMKLLGQSTTARGLAH